MQQHSITNKNLKNDHDLKFPSTLYFDSPLLGPFTHAIFVAFLFATLVAPEFCDKNHKCILTSSDFYAICRCDVAEVSNMFETSCNLVAPVGTELYW